MSNDSKAVLGMTVDTIGKDILSALVQEIKLLPDVWPKLSQAKQDDVIDRLRARVEANVKMAVHLLSSSGRTTVVGELEQMTVKDGVKVAFKVHQHAAGIVDLMQAVGKTCLLVVANADDHTGGMDDITGEPDQRAMDLGHEYHDNDGGGMDGGEVIDGEVLELPAPAPEGPTDEEKDRYWDLGWAAAEAGQPQSDCPVVASELVAAWIGGWNYYHEENPTGAAPASSGHRSAEVKYRHPEHTELTWTGRGRKPVWVQEWLDAGGSMADLEVSADDGDEREAA